MKYQRLKYVTIEQALKMLEEKKQEELMLLPMALGEYCEDWKFAQDVCLDLTENQNERIRVNALLGLSYIARNHCKLEKNKVCTAAKKVLKSKMSVANVYRAFDAIEDIYIFMKWRKSCVYLIQKMYLLIKKKTDGFMCKIIKNNLLIHLYMLLSVLGMILLFPYHKFALSCLSFGASSAFIALGIAYDLTINTFWEAVAVIWCIVFPVALVVAYILSFKKTNIPFCIMVIIDTLVVWIWSFFSLLTANYYSFKTFIPDLIISSLFTVLILVCIKQKKNRL